LFELFIDEKELECNKRAEAGCPKGAIKIVKI